MGRIYKRKNTKHEFGALTEHLWIRVEDEDGQNERWLRFTANDIRIARANAVKNQEDAPKVGFITDMMD